jgi:hypothetical protein
MSRYIVIISIIFFGFLGWQGAVFAQTPIPDIKVNGSDGPITLSQCDTLTLTIALDNNGITDNADWWLWWQTPSGTYYFYTFEGWTDAWQPFWQRPLYYLDLWNIILNMPLSGVQPGTHTFYFGIDTVMDGNLTWDSYYSDSVVVNITQPPAAVPTLSQWGMIILSLLLAGAAIFALRRRLYVA